MKYSLIILCELNEKVNCRKYDHFIQPKITPASSPHEVYIVDIIINSLRVMRMLYNSACDLSFPKQC